jgi:dihydrofolate reductase
LEEAMARLIMWNLMTLDGFVEGPNRDISWHPHVMNRLPKHVFSRTLTGSGWQNTQMYVDVPGTVARLKGESAKNILLFGSANLAASLVPAGLIDEFRLAVSPIILGGGSALFKPAERAKLKLLDARTLSTGVVILRYSPAT